MANDDDRQPLFGPELFVPTEFLADNMDHNVDVTGATSLEVEHSLDIDVPVRRIEVGVIAFAVLVVLLGVFAPVGATVQVSTALGAVAAGNLLVRTLG